MKRVFIWGTGQLSWHVINDYEGEITGFIDTFKKSDKFAERPVYLPEEITHMDYDAIIVAIAQTEGVVRTIAENGIDVDRVIFAYGNVRISDLNRDYDFIERICGAKLRKRIETRYHLVRSIDSSLYDNSSAFLEKILSDRMVANDYNRIATFSLLAKEINQNNIPGNTAELGVFRGDFAQYINIAFPEKKLYLFDTFSGFEQEELSRETSGMMREAGKTIFENTSIEVVRSKLNYPDMVDFKVGFFPDSLAGLEDRFCFVSIDCDWEESIFEGLMYFYPRLVSGGYIMIHDYNNYIGCAQKAVHRYEDQLDNKIAKVPISDNQGTLIVTRI